MEPKVKLDLTRKYWNSDVDQRRKLDRVDEFTSHNLRRNKDDSPTECPVDVTTTPQCPTTTTPSPTESVEQCPSTTSTTTAAPATTCESVTTTEATCPSTDQETTTPIPTTTAASAKDECENSHRNFHKPFSHCK